MTKKTNNDQDRESQDAPELDTPGGGVAVVSKHREGPPNLREFLEAAEIILLAALLLGLDRALDRALVRAAGRGNRPLAGFSVSGASGIPL